MAYKTRIVDGVEIRFVDGTRKQLTLDSKKRICEFACSLPKWNNDVRNKSERKLFLMEVAKAIGIKHTHIWAKSFIVNYLSRYENKQLEFNLEDAIAISRKPIKTVKVTFSQKIEETNNKIQELLIQVEELQNNISVLKQAKELMGAEL